MYKVFMIDVRKIIVILSHSFIGWALYGAAMGSSAEKMFTKEIA